MSGLKGYWIPVLHSHLPFVKHPEYDYFLEEHWLFEAITECYIPLLMKFKKLEDEGRHFRVTTSITPPLAEMLDDASLMGKYRAHLDKLLELNYKEIGRLQGDEGYLSVAYFYKQRLEEIRDFFDGFLSQNVLNGYRYFLEKGYVEVITCGATHGFLPLLSVNKKAVEVQIQVAVKAHNKHFGRNPEGIWLPECAYYDGLDEILSANGIKFFFMDSHGLVYGTPTPRYGVFAPVYTKAGVAAFARDPESSRQVWSSIAGYPGDPDYRDFYKDIGFELDYEYIKPYIDPNGVRVFTGMKYGRITGDTEHKEPYVASSAAYKASEHAKNFHHNRVKQVEHLGQFMDDRLPAIVSPYDAELFGHWWFEGPDFLYGVLKEMDEHGEVKAITPLEYLDMHTKNQMIAPTPSSWGDKGYYDVWLNSGNDWIYRHLHFMADRLNELACEHKNTNDYNLERLLNQLLRELLLAQSSDWAFLMTTNTAMEYSVSRTKEHISNFNKLLDMLEDGDWDMEFLARCEHKNSIFDFVSFREFC
jgi:1,4-alpha-glucan branching enzyme